MINHARSSPMNESIDTIANTTRMTPTSTPTTTPPSLTPKSNTDDDDNVEDDDDDQSERDGNHHHTYDTNSHTTIDEDLMTSYEASIDIEYNENIMNINNNHDELHNPLIDESFPVNSPNSMKKTEKQVTFQDIVEISSFYSITNESQESITHHYEDGDDEKEDDYNDDDDDEDLDEEEMKVIGKKSVNKKLKNGINSNDHKGGLVLTTAAVGKQNIKNSSDSNEILSEKDLLSLYTDWANHYLEKANYSNLIKNIQKDLSNGLLLADIIHAVANIKVQRLCRNPKTSAQSLHNVLACFQVLQLLGIETNGFTAQDIVDSKLKYILGLFFNLSKFKQQTRQLKQSQVYPTSSTSSFFSTSTEVAYTSSMIQLQKNHIPNEPDIHYYHHDHPQDSLIVKENHLHCQHQSIPPRPPSRTTTTTITTTTTTTTNNLSSSLSKQSKYQSVNKQENILTGQLKSPIKTNNNEVSNPCYSSPLILNKNITNQHIHGINASLNFTKPNVTSLRFPSSIKINTTYNSTLPSSTSSICNAKPLSPQHQLNSRQFIPRANHLGDIKGKTQKFNQSYKKSYDYQNISSCTVNSDTSNPCNSNSSSSTRSNKLQQKTLTTPISSSSSLSSTRITTTTTATSITTVTATSPTTPTVPTTLIWNNKQQYRQLNTSSDVVYDSTTTTTTTTTDELLSQQQNKLSEHKSAPVGISTNHLNKLNICNQFKASSFERSGLKSVSDLNIKSSKPKPNHHHNNQKQRNSPSPKKPTINKLSPSENKFSTGNTSPPSSSTSSPLSGIPMPRQFNLYQQSNMNSYHMSSSSSSSSSKIKESPTKLDRILYLNSPSQNQSTIDNHSMNNTTYNNNNLNISSIDNTYQTTNIQPRITLSQYYHTTQKQYPYYNQSITSMNKLSGNNNHTTSNTTNNNTTTITTPMTIHQPNTNQTLKHITTSQEISSSSSSSTNYAPPLPPPPLPHHHNHHSHHQQQQHQHHPIQHPNTFISGTNEFQHPMIPERSHSINPISSSTTQPLMSNYLHDTRRYMTGNSIFEQRPNPQHQFQPTQQTHQSNSHIIKTGISYSNDTNVICSTVNQSVPMGLPPPPPPSFTQYTQIHNHPSNINIQQYTPIIQPFVPPISYRPAAQAPNSNFMPISHCNYSNVTNIAPTVAMTTTTITTTTISTINGITTTTTTVNKNNAVINRRVRIQESSSQAQNLSNHQSMHSIQQMNTTTKTRQEMNVTTTTTATATSSGGAPNNLTYKHLPNMSSQTQNVKEITNPSSETIHSNHFPYQSETFNSIQPTGIYTTVSTSSGITSVTIANTTLTINRTEQQSSTPINNNPSISSSSYHRSLSKKPTDNTEQRRKARELYVALKQRYPSTNHNNSVNPSHRHQHQHQNHHHINADDDDHLSQTQTSDIKTLIKTNQNNETINVLEEHIDCSESNIQMIPSKFIEINRNDPDHHHHHHQQQQQQQQPNLCVSKTTNPLQSNSINETMQQPCIKTDNNHQIHRTYCGYQSDSAMDSNDLLNHNSNLTLPFHTKQLYNSNIIGSLPRNLHHSYSTVYQSKMFNLNPMKPSTNHEQQQQQQGGVGGAAGEGGDEEENLGNYARRMHERLQEGMREAQESLWMPDLPELNKMNRLSSSSSMNNNGNNSSSITQLSDGITNLSSSMDRKKRTILKEIKSEQTTQIKNFNDKIENSNMDNHLSPSPSSPPSASSPSASSPSTSSPSTSLFTNSISNNNNHSPLNSRLYWCNKLHNNQPMINNYNLQSIHNNEYSNMDIKYGVCSDVEDLLNQHERRLMSTSGNDSDKNVNELTKFNSASDTEEFLSNDYRIQASIRAMNYGHMGCDPIQPSSYNWLRKVNNNETVGDGLHNRYFIPPRLCNLDSSINQSDGFVSTSGISQQQSLLTRARRRQIDGRSLSSSIAKHDDAERIYGIVPLSPSYLYNQFMPSTGLMIKGMMSNSSSSSTRTNQDNEIHFPGTISAPPGTPIKLPYAAPASLIGTTSGFSCPESGSQIINGLGVNGSRLSLTSNGSCVSTVEEKQAEEIQKLKRKLEQAEKKVSELTTQLTTNVSL
uniref:Calponin-homology (CH) domain-containing protein n=1 Tax=Schistosoma mansoni TaxID=6183 RepID=A0A5K4F440_SCHMA